jgi:DNA-binding MarR family transcriptional regulator
MREEDVQRLRGQIRAVQQRLRRESRGGALSRTAWQVLAATERAPTPLTPGELTVALQMTSSNVAATLRELEVAGTVSRRRDRADARRVFVDLTAAGREMVAEYRRGKDAWLGKAIGAVLNEEEERVLLRAGELLRRLAECEVTG